MNNLKTRPKVQYILQEIDRLIAEMSLIRNEVAALNSSPAQAGDSVREAEYFGMWAERADMAGQSSREWLERLRTQQWSRQ